MFPMVTGFMNYGQQTVRAARYIGQSFIITLSHANRLPVTIQYPYEKLITSERFRGLNYSIDFGICIFCGNCVEYCPTNCLSLTEEYELSTYDRHELNYNQIALGRLPMSVIGDYTIRTIMNSTQMKKATGKPLDSRTITNY
uniref:NADH-plastoquinone oxidoreductase subunit I n=1 Tax=Helleborus argutifolius TaxID=171909 RepID=UPI0025AA1CDE|nr:NADH-plastoquinone oxidoreductase subunit I [Helleborus argutifolius]WIW41791.1 NADH-plastoquinone oxidoreductase subunit I [Helleborus argutifolius]